MCSLKKWATLEIREIDREGVSRKIAELEFDAPYDADQAQLFLSRGRARNSMEYILRTYSTERVTVNASEDKEET